MLFFLTLLYYPVIGGSIVALVVGVVRSRSGRTSNSAASIDPLEAAFLAGGPGRVADTALTAMHADGLITVARPGLVGVRQAVARHPVEQAVLDAHASASSSALELVRIGVMRSPAVQAVGDGLAERGLLVRPDAQRSLRRWAEWQMFLSLGAGLAAVVLTVIQYAELDGGGLDLPFLAPVLPACLAGFFAGRGCLLVFCGRCTGAGKRALRRFRKAADWGDPAHLVACHGPSNAPDPVLRDELTVSSRMRATGVGGSGLAFVGGTEVTWCGGGGDGGEGGGGSSCGGPSCGGSSGGSSCSGSSGGWSWSGSSGGSSCGGSSGGGSSCGSGGGGG